MDLLNCISELFEVEIKNISTFEKIKEFSASLEVNNLDYFLSPNISSILNIETSDDIILKVIVGNDDPITFNSTMNNIDEFVTEIRKSKKFLEDERISVIYSIYKNKVNNSLNVYNLKLFESFLVNISIVNLLVLLNNELNDKLYFNLIEDYEPFYTNSIYFIKLHDRPFSKDRFIYIECIRENCHFGNLDQYSFSPYDFYFIKRNNSFNQLMELFDRMTLLFSIISIYDITSIVDQNLKFRLNGYKVFDGILVISDLNTKNKDPYFKIFEWIYSESGKIVDKLGLARNILSIYLTSGDIKIDESVYFSICSGYKTYLQNNINRYIEIRNKIGDQLVEITNKAGNIIEKYIGHFQKSIITFASFFITVIVLRVLNKGNFENVFSKDATILSFAFMLVLFLYFAFSRWELDQEISRVQVRYRNLKFRFQDLLIPEDIDKILRDDQEFNDEISFIKSKRDNFSILWLLSILIFLGAIITLSSYVTWNDIFNVLKK